MILSAATWAPQSYYVVDPRFNWAPEDWMPRDDVTTGDKWLDWVTGAAAANGTDALLAADGRDSDIFMFVSNQGFLQSMGELAFLPRISDWGNMETAGATTPNELLAKSGSYNGNEHATSDSWTVIPNASCVWRSYRPYESSGMKSDCLMRLRNFYGTEYCSAYAGTGP